MANENAIVIQGYRVKELRCKNDSCRALFGYDNLRLGVLIHNCPHCGHQSIFNFQYKQMGKELIDKLEEKFVRGGEK